MELGIGTLPLTDEQVEILNQFLIKNKLHTLTLSLLDQGQETRNMALARLLGTAQTITTLRLTNFINNPLVWHPFLEDLMLAQVY